jgi:hypothetical protein
VCFDGSKISLRVYCGNLRRLTRKCAWESFWVDRCSFRSSLSLQDTGSTRSPLFTEFFDNFLLVACIIGALLVGKWIAASRIIRSVQPVNDCSTIECSMSCFCLCSQHQFLVRLTERFASRLTTGTPRYYQLGGRQFPEIAHHSQQTAQIAIAALR